MRLSNTTLFWILQFLGWGIPVVINASAKYNRPNLSNTYIIAETLLLIISGILASSLLRRFLKRNITFNKFNKKEWKYILIGYIGASLLYATLMFLALPINNVLNDNAKTPSTLIIISTIINAFIFILFWLILYLSIKLTRQYRSNQIKNLQLETALKDSELNTLKGQINPHFMFNSLNNIRGLMLEDVEKSRDMITRLSEMLRYSLTKNKVDTIALKEELEMVDNYIELSKIQFESRLQFTSQIDNTLLNVEIPPMIIQMLVENAIKHGISNLREGGSIHLSVSEAKKQLNIDVSNSGTLVKSESSTKVGLQNIKKRLALLYKDQASFHLKAEQNTVIATIKLPL